VANVGIVTTWGVTAGCVLLAVGASACSGADGTATTTTAGVRPTTTTTTTTTTAPERPASTTTTAYDPAAVEGQVEAAYLKSWDVYADAVYNLKLDEAALAEVYAAEHLETKRNEIQRRIDEGRASWVRVEHHYTIQLVDSATAIVVDQYVNHQVLIDPVTRSPTEPDPNQKLTDAVTLKLQDQAWRVTRKERIK
jgi:septal ring-binding cell division protein DamX